MSTKNSSPDLPTNDIQQRISETHDALRSVDESSLIDIAQAITRTFQAGGTVFAAGNGGSAAQAQHLIGELVGRFIQERPGFRAVTLGTDTVTTSAIGNDYGHQEIFARQLIALSRPGDLFIALSTSGSSPNMTEACRRARDVGVRIVSLVGNPDSEVAMLSDFCFAVPKRSTPVVQEMHLVGIHAICWLVEIDYVRSSSDA